MIDIDNVSFSYSKGNETLKNINLHINTGECILLCGKSGCGKTTTTKLINGLIPHFYEECTLSGKINVNGKSVNTTEIYELAKYVGSVFQNPKSQFFHLNSEAEIAFGLENCGTPKGIMLKKINETINQLHIEKLMNRNIFKMSGGEKQSLAFASVYSMNPEIYVLDEPTANLDEHAIELLREQIIKVKSENKTIIIAEHRLWFLKDIIDRAVYMENGKISKVFSKNEFFSLTNSERTEMGLRQLTKNSVQTTNATNDGCFIIKNLSYSTKEKQIFKNLSFSASNGEIIGIIGSNGTGKTTLLRCISGLIKPTNGNIYLNNKKLSCKARNKLCYMIMQDVNHQLFSDSVWGECEISTDNQSYEKINQILLDFNLLEYNGSHPMALSGGQKQRLAIATSILSGKQIILFDEPTSGLDYQNMKAVGKMLRKLASNGHIIILVTHDNEFLENCVDRVLRLRGTYE